MQNLIINLVKKYIYANTTDNIKSSLHSFKTEIELMRGEHINNNSLKSIIHFSFNKAATQYIKSVLLKCAIENGMIPVAFNEYAFNTRLPFLDHLTLEEMQGYKHIFKLHGYVYSVFGGMVEGIDSLDKYKIIFSVRDPRDMLVSSYYSQAYSHVLPDADGNKLERFMERRKFALNSTIDEYVLREAENVYKTFVKYDELLISRYAPVIHLVRYEDMVENFEEWLAGIISYCEFEVSDILRAALIAENAQMRPKGEDVQKHLRKGVPGDYKQKLLQETIVSLNDKLSAMINRFGYSC